MQKTLKFKLVNKNLPLLPNFTREILKNIYMEGNHLIINFNLTSNEDYIKSLAGFAAKKVEIKIDLMDDAACDVEISKTLAKKMLKDRSKIGYGRKSNIYAIRDFLKIYKDYPLEYSYSLVGNEKVHFVFKGKAKIEVEFFITCNEIVYIFSE